MENFKLTIDGDGVALVTFDTVGRSMNTLTKTAQNDIGTLVDLIRNNNQICGVVVVSGKPNGFCAGADLVEMEDDIERWRRARTQDELSKALNEASTLSRNLRALETLGKPVAVALNGVALGGGLEFALACHYRVGLDDPKRLRLGLPEVTIGLMPGAGGTQRLPRLMGVARALPYLLQGKAIELPIALETGIIHALAPAEELVPMARAWVLANTSASAAWDEKGFKFPGGGIHTPAGYAFFPYSVAKAVGDSQGEHAGRANILRAIYEGSMTPIDAALRIESRYFLNTVRSPEAAAMVRTMFHARQTLAKVAERSDPVPYIARLRSAWSGAAEELVNEGLNAAVVYGVARRLARQFSETSGTVPSRFIELPNSNDTKFIENKLFNAVGAAAEACILEGIVRSQQEANLLAVEAGFPVRTGGPVSPHADSRN